LTKQPIADAYHFYAQYIGDMLCFHYPERLANPLSGFSGAAFEFSGRTFLSPASFPQLRFSVR
jgi:hypothetical protein